ncbi:hypothetical protein ACFY2W_33300 [Streptomyces sp. NPDC001262]|uniref:hypothetical protein n=1 Tax=unclassified Streptomyces TaxID=2593676 RepID=UPI003684FDEB
MTQEPRINVEVTEPEGGPGPSADRLAEWARRLPTGPWFGMRLEKTGESPRIPSTEWELTGRPYQGQIATGRAAVYLSPQHRHLTRPFVFADGFNYGPSDLPALWNHLNQPYRPVGDGFLDQLLDAGIDVILLGFDARHTHIQANAGVAMACIMRAAQEMPRGEQQIVGGLSMGGVVTRYALAELERTRMDHRTGTYLSYDTPHNGAWIPLVLQQMAHFFEKFLPDPPDGGVKLAELLRSPAAQQLLWGWVADDRYSGPVAANRLRQQLLDDLGRLGGFPAIPVKLGVVSGAGNGVGRELPPGEAAFSSDIPDLVSIEARFQPDFGERQPIGHMSLQGFGGRRSDTTAVAAFDGAPGGTFKTFGAITDPLGIPIEDAYRYSCFVPSVSAVALTEENLEWPHCLGTDISSLAPDRYALDEICCETGNTEHGSVSQQLMEWILIRLAK